jgi:hypothetical protein
MVYTPPPDIAALSLAEIAKLAAPSELPVSQWNPPSSGDSRMRIASDGRWFHDGTEITRSAMVRAFSRLLRCEGQEHYLVTPHEKLRIEVEDAPFIATAVTRRDGRLVFTTNTGEFVIAGKEHPLSARGAPDRPRLYLSCRDGLEARLNRSTYVELAELALQDGEKWEVASGSARFSLIPR